MVIAIILILVAVALFLILRDDHDDSYTRSEGKTARNTQKSSYQKSVQTRHNAPKPQPQQQAWGQATQAQAQAPRPAAFADAQNAQNTRNAPYGQSAKNGQPAWNGQNAPYAQPGRKPLDFHFLDRMDYDINLPEQTMSSFIAGVQGYCTKEDLGGLVGYVTVDRASGAIEVHAGDGRLMGYLPMKDRAAYLAFNPGQIPCPFAGHIGISTTGRCYADIRIVLPSTRDFVEESLTGFLG